MVATVKPVSDDLTALYLLLLIRRSEGNKKRNLIALPLHGKKLDLVLVLSVKPVYHMSKPHVLKRVIERVCCNKENGRRLTNEKKINTEERTMMLTQAQKDFFRDNGYLVLEDVWSAEELAEARRQMNAVLCDPDHARPGVKFSYEPEEETDKHLIDPDNPRRVWMLFDTPLAGDWWYDNIRDPRIALAMADLLGPNINFHNGKARIKPPGYGTHQAWHQDWPYEYHTSPDLAAALFYLDDTDVGAAATEVIPGSHRRGEWSHDENNIIPDADVEAFGVPAVPVSVRAGSVAIIHVLIVHRATPNATTKNRSAIINEYKTMETQDRWGNKCAFAELPLVRNGKSY